MQSVGNRVARLRAHLAERLLVGFVVPRADEHQGEYVPPRAQRLAYICGFTGSAGSAVILQDRAAVFVDGRYTLQAAAEVDQSLFEIVPIAETSPSEWISTALDEGDVLAIDPWLHTKDGFSKIEAAVTRAGGRLQGLDINLVDEIWDDQPEPPQQPVEIYPENLAGKSSLAKRQEIGKVMDREKVDAALLTLPDSIAWLLNIRGSDVERIPVTLSFAILYADGHTSWFVDQGKVSPEVQEALGTSVTMRDPEGLVPALVFLGKSILRVRVDPSSAPYAALEILKKSGAVIDDGPDPCLLPKAAKNAVELDGMRAAHHRDAVAVTKFLNWLDTEGPKGGVTEMSAAAQLMAYREETNLLRDLSFDTISGAGPNGAIVHYRVSEESNRPLGPDEMYLCDSGAQYQDGTTDITRTVINGTPTDEMKDRYTRVLKGHIAIATAVFPEGTTGSQLDILARQALWQVGLDFDHGTGHGVGCFLSVHEGPQRISKTGSTIKLQPGMILSNEPGYYKTGAYGIRIENLVVVEKREIEGSERPMLGFETITFAPIDTRLVEPSLLTDAEKGWLNAYHAEVRSVVGPQLQGDLAEWLETKTAALP